MALGKNQNKSVIYLKVKDGFFYKSDDKEHSDPYDTITGQIVSLGYKEETFNNSKINKFQITLVEGGDRYILQFPVESPMYSSFISFARNTNLSKPVNLHAKADDYESKGSPVKRTKILISVGDDDNRVYSKAYFTKAGPNVFPTFKKVRINGNDLWDKTDFLDFAHAVVENDLKPQLPGNAVVFKEPVKKAVAVEEDNDMPF